jgi:predicted regulator of Ras-like GTPase activity (Roadblock/LC7/MglB family)
VGFGIFLEAFIAMTAHFDFVAIFFIVYLLGAIIQSTLDEEQTSTHAKALSDLTSKASSIVGMLNQDDELTFLRIRSKQREIMVSILEMNFILLISLTRSQCFVCTAIAPTPHSKISPDKDFLLVVLQNPRSIE